MGTEALDVATLGEPTGVVVARAIPQGSGRSYEADGCSATAVLCPYAGSPGRISSESNLFAGTEIGFGNIPVRI